MHYLGCVVNYERDKGELLSQHRKIWFMYDPNKQVTCLKKSEEGFYSLFPVVGRANVVPIFKTVIKNQAVAPSDQNYNHISRVSCSLSSPE